MITNNNNLNPRYVTGLVDSDGNFYVGITPSTKNTIGWQIHVSFSITAAQNYANYIMLQNIQNFFGGIGQIKIDVTKNVYYYTVSKFNECLIIQNHFLNYPLLTYKLVYFQLWSQIMNILSL